MSSGRRIWYVECPQFRSHPTTYGQAKYLADCLNEDTTPFWQDRDPSVCREKHKVKRLVMLADYLDLPEPDSPVSDVG